ncbi:hypothetical protein AAW14_20395 [Streptomyces hygroscopicus]|nr:hypothetical protein [Streptomyces hygroscopicus]
MRQTSTTRSVISPVPVFVQAWDPISLAGVTSQLELHPSISLVTRPDESPGTVAVLVSDIEDDSASVLLHRRLMRSGCARTVLVTNDIRVTELLDLIECGVSAVVWRHEASAGRLHQAVHTVARGEGCMPPDLLAGLMRRVAELHRRAVGQVAPPTVMSALEIDILHLVAAGMDDKEIAGRLGRPESDVKRALRSMTARLGLRSRAHAIAHALREGYI